MTGQKRTRISRALIGVLVVTIAVGAMFYLHHPKESEASGRRAETQTAQQSHTPAVVARPAETALAEPAALITQTPTLAAATVSVPTPTTAPAPTTRKTESAVASPPTSVNPIEEGKAKIAAGDLLGG